MTAAIATAVVFDIGGVLVDWNPRHLYRKLLSPEQMDDFLSNVCTLAWHSAHDRGIPMTTTAAELKHQHPQYSDLIDAWRLRWSEMFGGPITGTVALLEELVGSSTPVHGLTNWPAEKFGEARDMFPFLAHLEPTVVSGEVGVAKPDPVVFDILIERTGLNPARTLYIDDAPANVQSAADHGFIAHRFTSSAELAGTLRHFGVLPQKE